MSTAATKEQIILEELSNEALQILEVLDQIENHTAILRKKLLEELRPKNQEIRLKLEEV
jgi:hypothetical protein